MNGGPAALERGTWTSYGSTWSMNGSRLENASEERGARYILTSETQADYQIEADIHITSADGEAGLVLRSHGEETGVDAYHGYFAGVRVSDATLEFGRADFGWQVLQRISLPATLDLSQGFHLRVVAIGCSFGVEVRSPSGVTQALTTADQACIASGHSGVRSNLTSAVWDHLAIRSASKEDLAALHRESAGAVALPIDVPFVPQLTARYETSLEAEARKRALQAGVQPIVTFLMQPGRHPNVTLQGTVISLPPLVAIQDETNALIVPAFHSNAPLKLGDIVLAHGTVLSERFRSSLENADIRVLWSDLAVPPLAVTAAQLTGGTYRGRAISIEGTLVSTSDHDIILRDGDLIFRGVVTGSTADLHPLERGSRIRLRGIATSLDQYTHGTYPFAVVVEQVDVVSSPPWWSPRHIAVLGLTSVLVLLLIQIGLHRAQQWHLQSVMKEREQLAFEMHDTLAQSFTGIAYLLNAAIMERRGENKMQTHVQNALEMVHISHREASRTIAALRPQLRDATAILEALEQVATRLVTGDSPKIQGHLTGRVTALSVQVTDALFRVGQEAISNAIQHSGCTQLEIHLVLHRREAALTVHDNGRGFDAAAQRGLGITGMHSRAAKVRGRLEIQSVPHRGTSVSIVAPLPLVSGLLRPLWQRMRAFPSRSIPLGKLETRSKPYDYSR
ncbi:hypothetical protein GCM10011586_23440 [Silvibacterium dinghuense]|nr:hypothetical protein GCM10011586_23440 [Silvibacterium dinghuense]